MGFDLAGMNPEEGTPKPIWTKGDPWIKEGNRIYLDPKLDKEYTKHMDEVIEWQDSNPGAYFRANVWFWRPLWNFVTNECKFLTDKDVEQGGWNNGHRISKTKSKRIASRLRRLINNGHVHAHERWYKRVKTNKTDYPFSTKLVVEFANFCEKSGGFEIC